METPRAHFSPIANDNAALRRAVRIVVLLNLGYFGIKFGVALAIGSVSLFADSIDFLEDAAVTCGGKHERQVIMILLFESGN